MAEELLVLRISLPVGVTHYVTYTVLSVSYFFSCYGFNPSTKEVLTDEEKAAMYRFWIGPHSARSSTEPIEEYWPALLTIGHHDVGYVWVISCGSVTCLSAERAAEFRADYRSYMQAQERRVVPGRAVTAVSHLIDLTRNPRFASALDQHKECVLCANEFTERVVDLSKDES